MDLTTITITASTIFSLFGGNTGDGKFLYKTEFTPEQVVCGKTIYENNDGFYLQTYHYVFKYDEQNRLQRKEVQTWNAADQKWENAYCLSFEYKNDEQSVVYSNWNARSQDYSDFVEKTTYQSIGEYVFDVTTHKWNDQQENWAFVNRLAVYDPAGDLLTTIQ